MTGRPGTDPFLVQRAHIVRRVRWSSRAEQEEADQQAQCHSQEEGYRASEPAPPRVRRPRTPPPASASTVPGGEPAGPGKGSRGPSIRAPVAGPRNYGYATAAAKDA